MIESFVLFLVRSGWKWYQLSFSSLSRTRKR